MRSTSLAFSELRPTNSRRICYDVPGSRTTTQRITTKRGADCGDCAGGAPPRFLARRRGCMKLALAFVTTFLFLVCCFKMACFRALDYVSGHRFTRLLSSSRKSPTEDRQRSTSTPAGRRRSRAPASSSEDWISSGGGGGPVSLQEGAAATPPRHLYVLVHGLGGSPRWGGASGSWGLESA